METVKSADGTVIAFDRVGFGPPLVVTLGAFCDRMTFVPPDALTARFTVYTWDRRGRGGSGDTAPYSPDLEVADLSAVIEATGAEAFVYGHSSGAALALRAAWSGVPMARLVAYEAPFIIPGTREVPTDPSSTITRLVEAGQRGEAVRFWMADVVGLPPQVVAHVEGTPMWAGLEAMTHTLPYDLALTAYQGVPADLLARLSLPVLVLGGAKSPDWFRQSVEATTAAIPGARLVWLECQDHGAPPEVLTPVLTEFFLGL